MVRDRLQRSSCRFLLIDPSIHRRDRPWHRDTLEMDRFTLRAEAGYRAAHAFVAGGVDPPLLLERDVQRRSPPHGRLSRAVYVAKKTDRGIASLRAR